MVAHLPDRRLVYLHCSSIFKGTNTRIRKLKKIIQLLSQHENSLKILTNEFTLDAIAAVARWLLDERIFESQARARIHFPELFQPSETQEAEREAAEAEVARIEAETAQETVVTSDEDWGSEIAGITSGQDQQPATDAHPETVEQGSQNAPNEHW